MATIIIHMFTSFGVKPTNGTVNALGKLVYYTSIGNLPAATTSCVQRFYDYPIKNTALDLACPSGTITSLNDFGFIQSSFEYNGKKAYNDYCGPSKGITHSGNCFGMIDEALFNQEFNT